MNLDRDTRPLVERAKHEVREFERQYGAQIRKLGRHEFRDMLRNAIEDRILKHVWKHGRESAVAQWGQSRVDKALANLEED